MIALGHENLESHYKLNFALMQHHKYSLTELENMMPFEREIYVILLTQFLKEQKEKQEQQKNQMR